MIKVLVVDDHKVFREGIATLLEKQENIEVVALSGNKQEMYNALNQYLVDIILMDITIGKENGIEITKELTDNFSDIAIIALSMHNETNYILEMIEAGASGYLLKDTGSHELCEAINTIYNGGNYFRGEVAKAMLDRLRNKQHPQNTKKSNIPLSKRETEVLKLIVDEFSNQEIANELFISIRTVETHKRNLIEKLDVKNTTGLVKYAIKNKIVNLD